MDLFIRFTRGSEDEGRWLESKGTKIACETQDAERLSGEEVKRFYENLLEYRESGHVDRGGGENQKVLVRPSKTADCVQRISEQGRERLGHQMLGYAQDGDLRRLRNVIEKRGVDINFKDDFFWTAVMCSAYAGHYHVVQYLLQAGAAWVGVVDTKGRDAVALAEEAGHGEVVRLLQSFRPVSYEEEVAPAESSSSEGPAKRFCAACKVEYKQDSVQQHERSTVHLLSLHRAPPPTYYGVPESNVGFQMMLRNGWDSETGLGPAGKGRRFPVKTLLKRDHRGLGYTTSLKAKVTHFQPHDIQAVERPLSRQVTRTERVATVNRREAKRRQQKDKAWERDLRTCMDW
ncbi:GPAN1 protein, partial [Polypterus senegalus]